MPLSLTTIRSLMLSTALVASAAACNPAGDSGKPNHDPDTKPAATAAKTDSVTPLPYGKGGAVFTSVVTTSVNGKEWSAPNEAEIPADSMGASIRRGLALIQHLTDSLPEYATGDMNCTNCHLQNGRSRYGSPLIGTAVRYPRYIARSAAVVTMADRINFCITRSLAGNRLPTDSREMTDMITYLHWLSKGLPQGAQTPGSEGLISLKAESTPDPVKGETIYASKCQSCHQADGSGVRPGTNATPLPSGVPAYIPPLWGARSYSVGASMARVERAASFIAHNMPYGQAGTMTVQESFDVAAYINSKPRPDLPKKENDWPAGGAPGDLPYSTTSGHQASNPPPLLPRRTPERTLVAPPPRAARSN
ncbi:MAG: c-type cytochrome [Gemmatimonas sp.]